jgi:asparagine synthase (glutamine-hydrolysing)
MRLPFVSRALNLERVGQTLVVLREDAVSTTWKGISLLPNGHRLRVDAENVHVGLYWQLADAPEVRFASDGDYVEAFREQFDRSVAGYLRSTGPLAATLSGGLDSALLVESSARQLRASGERLHAFTSVPAFDVSHLTPGRQMGDEREFAAAVARQVGGIDHYLLEGSDITPVAGIARVVEQSDTLDYGVGNCFWLCSMLDAAAAASSKALLMGAAGNASVSWDGGSYVAHVDSWPPTPGAIVRWHQRVGGSWLQAFRSLVLAPLVPRRVRALRARKATSRYTSWQGYSAMNPKWFEEQGFAEKIQRSGRSLLFERPYHPDPRDEQLLTLRPDRRQGQGAWSHLTANTGVQARDPTADHRLVEFCLGLPSRQYQRDGVSRYLARRALEARVPDQVVWNRRRGLQAADLALRIRQSAGEVRSTLDRLQASDTAREMLDLPYMRRVLESAETAMSPEIGLESELILMRGISAGLFLVGAEG